MTGNASVGILGVAVASLVWGSNFIVCKGYELPSDGIHFAFLMSIGILLVGLLSLFSSEMEDGDYEAVFSPCGLLGGALWACGNFLTVPIIQAIGLGVGLAIWAGVNMIVAFVVGAIGMEGMGVPLPKEPLSHPTAGVFGVIFGVTALCLFANIKSGSDTHLEGEVEQADTNLDDPAASTNERDAELSTETPVDQPTTLSQPLLEQPEDSPSNGITNSPEANQDVLTGNVPLGVLMGVVAGAFYGFNMVPLSIWNNKITRNGHMFNHPLPSDLLRSLRFFFSQFAGIFLVGITGFGVYCVCTKNKPKLVPPEATLPSIICGMVWAVGCAGAIVATSELGQAVGYVLVLNGSFLVNSAWSILVFKEIQGERNLKLFGGAFSLIVLSSIMISVSKA